MKTYLKYITPSDYANPTRSTCSQIFLQQYFTVIQLLVLIFGYQKLTVSVPFPCSLFGFLEWQQVILKIRELILCLNWCYIFLNERHWFKSWWSNWCFVLCPLTKCFICVVIVLPAENVNWLKLTVYLRLTNVPHS